MTRKVTLLTAIYFALGILSFGSCEWLLSYKTSICDIEFTGIHSIWNPDASEPDTFGDQIGFGILAVETSPTCHFGPLPVFTTAYATTKCAKFQNEILASTYQLSFNRPFFLDGNSITPNADILDIPDISSLTDISINVDCKFTTSEIIFQPALIDRIEFETGEYEVTFKCSTSDGLDFTKTRKVIFKS